MVKPAEGAARDERRPAVPARESVSVVLEPVRRTQASQGVAAERARAASAALRARSSGPSRPVSGAARSSSMAGSSRARDGAASRAKQPLGAIRDDAPRHIASARCRTREGYGRDSGQVETGAARSERPQIADFGSGAGRPAAHLIQTGTAVSTRADSDRPDSSPHVSAVDAGQPQEPALAARRQAPTGAVPC